MVCILVVILIILIIMLLIYIKISNNNFWIYIYLHMRTYSNEAFCTKMSDEKAGVVVPARSVMVLASY